MKRLFRVTALLSSSSLLEIILNILKTKLIALLTGTMGIGLLGLYQSLINLLRSLASVFAGAGVIQTVAGLNPEEKARLYQALLRYVIRVSLLVSLALVVLSRPMASFFFTTPSHWREIIGFAVVTPVIFLGIFWRSWLNGLRRIHSLATIKIQATAAVALVSILLVYTYGLNGVYLAALFCPVPMAVFAYRHVRPFLNQQEKPLCPVPPSHMRAIIRRILATGHTLLLSSLLFTFSVVMVKGFINRHLGSHSLGLFQASWQLAMVYIELLLAALGMDFFPRLAAAIKKHQPVNSLVNQQLSFSLMLATPVILTMMLIAPWLLQWLYSREFQSAESTLHWLLLGDFFKVISWILGYVLIAYHKLRWSLLLQVIWVTTFMAGTVSLLEPVETAAPGVAFALAYIISAVLSMILVTHQLNIRLDASARFAMGLSLACALVASIAIGLPEYRTYLLLFGCIFSTTLSLTWFHKKWKSTSAGKSL